MARVDLEEFEVGVDKLSSEIITLKFVAAIKVDMNVELFKKVLAEEGLEWDRKTAIEGITRSIKKHLEEIVTNDEDIKVGIDCKLVE